MPFCRDKGHVIQSVLALLKYIFMSSDLQVQQLEYGWVVHKSVMEFQA